MRNTILAIDATYEAAKRGLTPGQSATLTSVTVYDQTGNGRHLTATAVTLIHDGTRWVFRFNGTTSYLVTQANVDMTGLGQRLILGCRLAVTPQGTDRYVVSCPGVYSSVTTGFALLTIATTGQLYALYNGDVGITTYRTTAGYTAGHAVIASYDKALSTGEVSVAVDGAIAAGSVTLDSDNTNAYGNHPIYIGRHTSGSNFLAGDIARLVLCHDSDGAWSDTDAELMRAWLGGANGLVPDVVVNGVDLSLYGFVLEREPGARSAPRRDVGRVVVRDRPGAIVSVRGDITRPFSLVGRIEAASVAEKEAYRDRLNAALRKMEPCTLVLGADVSRQLTAHLLGFAVADVPHAWDTDAWPATLEFDAADPPYWEDVAVTTVSGIGSTPVAIPCGIAPVYPEVVVSGATNPTLTLRDKDGTPVAVMTVTGDFVTGGNKLCLDFKKLTAYRNTTGIVNTGTDVMGSVSITTGDWFVLKQPWYDWLAADWMTLEVSSGTAVVTIRNAYY